MANLRFLVSLTNNDNDYQIEQAADAQAAARRLAVEVEIIHANNDAIEQSQQILKAIQRPIEKRPDAILAEPVGSPLVQAARAAVGAGIGWVLLNREAEYIGELRKSSGVPVFSISSDHAEIGRVQGRQFGALLPKGGTVLYIQGPTVGNAAAERTRGMLETKPANIQVKMLRGNWTEESAQRAVSSWLNLSTSKDEQIDVVGAQDDSMAMGARKAFEELSGVREQEKLRKLMFTGCDGLPKTGQAWVRRGWLKATVCVPANTGLALELLVKALRTEVKPPEMAFTAVTSYPALNELARRS